MAWIRPYAHKTPHMWAQAASELIRFQVVAGGDEKQRWGLMSRDVAFSLRRGPDLS